MALSLSKLIWTFVQNPFPILWSCDTSVKFFHCPWYQTPSYFNYNLLNLKVTHKSHVFRVHLSMWVPGPLTFIYQGWILAFSTDFFINQEDSCLLHWSHLVWSGRGHRRINKKLMTAKWLFFFFNLTHSMVNVGQYNFIMT